MFSSLKYNIKSFLVTVRNSAFKFIINTKFNVVFAEDPVFYTLNLNCYIKLRLGNGYVNDIIAFVINRKLVRICIFSRECFIFLLGIYSKAFFLTSFYIGIIIINSGITDINGETIFVIATDFSGCGFRNGE